VAIEINTGLLRRPVAELAPERQILEWYRQAGGEHLTIGSDAHLPQHVGLGLERAGETAQAAGFSHLTRFVARKPLPQPLPRLTPPP
jgi:histidinol-phosphatase (PHP family)